MINSTKSSFNTIYNAIDLSSGGFLSLAKTNIESTYKGFFEEKIDNLIIDLKRNSITETEIFNYINTIGEYDKNILFSIIQKNIASDHKIKTFLLSKILFYKIKNNELDYFKKEK